MHSHMKIIDVAGETIIVARSEIGDLEQIGVNVGDEWEPVDPENFRRYWDAPDICPEGQHDLAAMPDAVIRRNFCRKCGGITHRLTREEVYHERRHGEKQGSIVGQHAHGEGIPYMSKEPRCAWCPSGKCEHFCRAGECHELQPVANGS